MRQGDQEAYRYVDQFKALVNRKNIGMVGARNAVVSKVGVALVDGRAMRVAVDDRGQPHAIMQAKDDCNKKKLEKTIILIT